MDKDMMAKINEALKANDRRELSLDELDKVVGGYVPKTDEDKEQLAEMFYAMTDTYGFDVALDMFMQITGYTTYRAGVKGGGTDRDKMGVVLNGYFTMLEAGGGYH